MKTPIDFMNWMMKINNIHYTNDLEMSKALEKFKKSKKYADKTSKGKIRPST